MKILILEFHRVLGTGWQKTWNNLEFENLGKKKPEKTWNFVQKSRKNLEFRTKIVVKPGIFSNLNVLTNLIE